MLTYAVCCRCVMCGNCSNDIHRQTISKHTVLPLNVRAQAVPSEEERALAAHAAQEKVRALFVSWMEEEEARMRAHKLPLKRVADAEEYELDPERFTCFTTVQKYECCSRD